MILLVCFGVFANATLNQNAADADLQPLERPSNRHNASQILGSYWQEIVG
jgi:hypothetical protein